MQFYHMFISTYLGNVCMYDVRIRMIVIRYDHKVNLWLKRLKPEILIRPFSAEFYPLA